MKCIFLDRDGTLIVDKNYPNDPNAIEFLPEVFEGLKKLQASNFQFIVVSNQSGVAKGIVEEQNVLKIHENMQQELLKHGISFLDWFYAPFLSQSQHYYRKPRPGMVIEAQAKHAIDLTISWVIGDKECDIELGHNCGCRSIMYNQKTQGPTKANLKTDSFLQAAEYILNDGL